MGISQIVDSLRDRGLYNLLSTSSLIEFILCFTYLSRYLSNRYPIGRVRSIRINGPAMTVRRIGNGGGSRGINMGTSC